MLQTMEPTALEPPKNVQIAVARASAVSHARDVDVCPVRLEVLLHLSLGTGGRGARPRPCHRQNHIFSASTPMEPLHEYEKTCKHHMCVPPVCLEGLSLECVAGVAPRQEALRERLWLWRIERTTRSCVPSLMLVPVVASQVSKRSTRLMNSFSV